MRGLAPAALSRGRAAEAANPPRSCGLIYSK